MLGGKLRRARRLADITVRAVAQRSSCSPSFISDIERERRPPPPPGHRVLRAYAELFQLSSRALDRISERERRPVLLGVPWHRRAR